MADPIAVNAVRPLINIDNVAYCPSMDLIALVTVDGHARVFRFNGQTVLDVSDKQSSGKVSHIHWKPDGNILALGINEHNLFLANCSTGKVSTKINCNRFTASTICCLGWGAIFTDSKALRLNLDTPGGSMTLDDIITQNPRLQTIATPADLPLHLAFVNVEGSLPKLCPIVNGEMNEDTVTSRTTIENLLQPLTADSTDILDVLVVGFEDGTVHLSAYDVFEIGTFKLPLHSPDKKPCKPLMHCSHPLSSTQALIATDTDHLLILPLDLCLISRAGRYLPLLASKTTQLQTILQYLRQVQRQLCTEFRASQDLPQKFMRNVEEELSSKSDSSWVQSAYHLVVTGDCQIEVQEWLVDQLGERGQRRWEKAVVTGYENARRLAHENLLPALERLTVLVSALRGLSHVQSSNGGLGLLSQDLNIALDAIQYLQLAANEIIIIASKELQQFKAFSAWLQLEIEQRSVDPSLLEHRERDSNIDYAKTLEYIGGPMMHSQLIRLLDPHDQVHSDSHKNHSDHSDYNSALSDLCDFKIGQSYKEDAVTHMPGLHHLLEHLEGLCNITFARLAEAQRRNVRFGEPICLGPGSLAIMDSRMIVQPKKTENVELFILLGAKNCEASVQLYRVTLRVDHGMSSLLDLECAYFTTGGWKCRDAKFVDDHELILAVSNDSASRLLRLFYRQRGSKKSVLCYHHPREIGTPRLSIDFSDLGPLNEHTWLKFDGETFSAPERLVINGRKGRRAVCVVSQDRHIYRIYDLENESEKIDLEAKDDNVVML